MKMTKLLCKYLDRDGKGYVTAGNLITAASKLGFLSTIAAGYVRGATIIARYWDGNVSTTAVTTLNDVSGIDAACIPFTVVGTAYLLTIILAFVLAFLRAIVEEIWDTKIAKCERKEGDDQHDNI